MKGLSASSKSGSLLNYTAYDAKKGSATFYSRNTQAVPVKSPQLKGQQSPYLSTSSLEDGLLKVPQYSEYHLKHRASKKKFQRRLRDRQRKITKELEDIIFNKLGVSITNCECTRINLMHITIHIMNQIKNKNNPIKLRYNSNYFLRKSCQINKMIEEDDLSPDQLKARRHKLLLNKMVDILNLNLPKGNFYVQVFSSACDYLNDYLKQTSTPMEEVSEKGEPTSILQLGTLSSFHNDPLSEIGDDSEDRVIVSSTDGFELGAIETIYSSNVSTLNHTTSDERDGFATFYLRSTRDEVSVESPHIKNQDSEIFLKDRSKQQGYEERKRKKEQKITKELKDILFDKFGISIPTRDCSKPRLMHIIICLVNQIKNRVDPIQLHYNESFFQMKNKNFNESIRGEILSDDQVIRKKNKLLLNEIKDTLNVNFTKGNYYNVILTAARDYLNDYLKKSSALMKQASENIESTSILRAGTLSSSDEAPVNPTRVKNDHLKTMKGNKKLIIEENMSTKELEDVLFGKFSVNIVRYGSSKNKLIDATIFIIKQIKNKVETINLIYDMDYFQKRSRQVISLIKERGLSPHQVSRKKQHLLLEELKAILDIDVTKDIGYEQILSEACNYLNGYLNQKIDSTADSDDNVVPILGSTQPIEPQPLSQSIIPLISLPREEELTIAEQSSLIRLKNALNRYPIPQIDSDNYGELLFAAAYCIKMNSNMMQVSKLDYNHHYVKHFHAPYPYSNPRDEIEDHLDDLEKALSEESMNSAIKQFLNHQKDALPEAIDLENTGLDSLMDTLKSEALFTTSSLNQTVRHREDDTDSARVQKITAALDLAVQYLENEEYLKLQNSLAHQELIDYEPVAKKSKSDVTV